MTRIWLVFLWVSWELLRICCKDLVEDKSIPDMKIQDLKRKFSNSPRKSKHKTTAMQYTNEPMKYLVGEKVILLLAIIVQALF